MATLNSPGVSVTVIDESFYTPAAPGTVPLIVVASAANKSNAGGTGLAQGTLAENVGKVWVITSQRDLVDTFGTPSFPTNSSGNTTHGSEQNEYGLQAAYSVLGLSSRAYVTRADVDLSQLAPVATAPAGAPVAGTYWLDTDASLYGVNEWSSTAPGSFKVKNPLIIDDSNMDENASSKTPNDNFGTAGDYAMYITSENQIQLWYKTSASSSSWTPVDGSFDSGKELTISAHYNYPTYTTSTVNGSVWVKTTSPGLGAKFNVKYYNGSTSKWDVIDAPVYTSTSDAIYNKDNSGGGANIPVGSLFVESNYNHLTGTSKQASFKLWRRNNSGATTVTFDATTSTSLSSTTFRIRETLKASTGTEYVWSTDKIVTVSASPTASVASLIPAAMSAAGLTNVTANFNATTQKLTFTHALGGDIQLKDVSGTPLATAIRTATGYKGLVAYDPVTKLGTPNLNVAATGDTNYSWLISNWQPLVFEAKESAPVTKPADGTLWFNSTLDADILIHDGLKWVGYRTADGYPLTDPNGPMISALEPEANSNGDSLVLGDIWISTSDMENYGKNIYVYNGEKWIKQDVTDQNSPEGWLFADARWATTGSTLEPSAIRDLLTSNYVDPDCPDPALYPKGMRLLNTRRSGFNVKRYQTNYINIEANNGTNIRTGEAMTSYEADRWVGYQSVNEDGSGRFGRHAQRGVVVAALKSVLDTNEAIRDTDTLVFNLISCPGYPETIANMIGLNNDRGQTAFVVGDTPFRLRPNGTDLTAWGSNSNLAFDNGDDGLISADEYLGVFYPSGYTTDNLGNEIVVPPSHMMLRTIISSDAKSYQWYAPAGTRRGGVDNATSVGYIDSTTGEFQTVALHQGLRDVLQGPTVNINPIATFPGIGLVNFGQKTRARSASALDRINVVRLVAYLRRQLEIMAKPYLFEPNDAQTRKEIKAAADSLLLELVGLRAIYDFLTVCDESNNTNARVDRSELWLDIAIEPVKAVEFIYIPLRIKNTGEISSGA